MFICKDVFLKFNLVDLSFWIGELLTSPFTNILLSYTRVTQIKTYSWDNAQVILVGNKCDMEDERVISFERGKQLSEQLGIEFFETSAKENINVKVSC